MEADRSAGRRGPAVGVLLGLGQGGVYAFLAAQAWGRWPLAAVLLGLAALAQGLGAARAGRPGARGAAGVASLGLVGVVMGLHVQALIHVIRAFHPVGAGLAWEALAGTAAALPWVLAVPIWQVASARAGRRGGVAALVAVPVALAGLAGGPDRVYPAQDGAAVARWAHARVTGEAGAPPSGPGPVLAVVSVVEGGEVVGRRALRGDDLSGALASLDLRERPGPRVGVVVEIAVAEGPLRTPWMLDGSRAIVRPGVDEVVGDEPSGARAAWLAGPVVVAAGPTLAVPGLPAGGTRWVRYEGWLAGADRVVPLEAGWAKAPALDADAARDAALRGAAMIAAGQRDDGRYAYVVHGPSGRVGSGYNFPRHAGATWFLALAARRDASLRDATTRGLEFLRAHTRTDGDRSFVLDPDRRDGLAWVGTTALALMAVLEAEGPTPEAAGYAAFVASSVDADGRVRGDFDLRGGAFQPQPEVTYAQGQALLALALAERAGVPGVRDALVRAADWSDRGYRPGSPVFSLDDHWGCIAADAVHEAIGRPAGLRACDAWLATVRDVPRHGAPLQPPAGPAGAVAEAWVARALVAERRGERGRWAEVATRYGRVFVAQQYREADAPLLGAPHRLLGGFRDRPWALDVRVDAVQHVGCALLGVERLLRSAPPSG